MRERLKIPILVYHRISQDEDFPIRDESDFYMVSAGDFRKQMSHLHDTGYNAINLSEFLKKKDMPLNPVIITFDDGNISNYKIAWPILKEFNLKASFFVVVRNIDLEGFMNRGQIRELSKEGVEIGSHGLTHRDLTGLTNDILVNELENSKDILAKVLGSPVELLSLPGGCCNRRVKEAIRDTGYRIVCTSRAGVNDLDTDELFLKRIAIRSDTDLKEFMRLFDMSDFAFTMERFKAAGRGAFKRVIGIKNYTFIKERLIGAKR